MRLKIYKFLLLLVTLTLLNVQSSFARTTGDFLTLKMSQNNVSSGISYTSQTGSFIGDTPSITTFQDPSFSSTNHSVGVDFSKTLRFNKFTVFDISLASEKLEDLYIIYGVFFDNLDYNNYVNNKYNVTINSRYGANLGLGYDLSDEVAIYSKYGISSVDYEIDSRGVFVNARSNGTDSNRAVSSIFYAGLNYKLLEDVLIGLEYSRQEVDLKSSIVNSGQTIERHVLDTVIESFSFNIMKNF